MHILNIDFTQIHQTIYVRLGHRYDRKEYIALMNYRRDDENMFYSYDDQNKQQNGTQTTGNYSGSYYDTTYRETTASTEYNKKPKKGKGIFLGLLLLIVGMAAGAGVCFGMLSYQKNQADDVVVQEEAEEQEKAELQIGDTIIEEVEENLEDVETTESSAEMSVQEIAQRGLPSVVAITNKGITEVQSLWGNFTQESESSGSGVIIGKTDNELLILTNYHVIEGNEQLTVVFSYEEATEVQDTEDAHMTTALVKDYDSSRDIAVIAIPMDQITEETLEQISVAAIGDSEALELGQQVVAIGNALGYGQSVTTGIVSALNRSVGDAGEGIGCANLYIQTDAAINPGNSGGALFNMHGQLVGINSAKIASSSVEGMGYAIPITDIFTDVESMMNQETRNVVAEEERGYLGVSVVDVTADVSKSYGLPQGVYINSVNEGSGAEAAGMKKGDIVTAVNGKTVRSVSELKEYLSYYKAGETVTLTLQRVSEEGYKEAQLDVTLIKADEIVTEEEAVQEQMPEEEDDSYYNLNPFGNFFPFGMMP